MADWEWYADYPAAIRRVTPEDVRRVARAYFHDDGLTVGLYLPKPEHGEEPALRRDLKTSRRPTGRRPEAAASAPVVRQGRVPFAEAVRRRALAQRRELLRPREPLQPDRRGLRLAPRGPLFAPPGPAAHRVHDRGGAAEGHGATHEAPDRRGPREPRRVASRSPPTPPIRSAWTSRGAALSRDVDLLLDRAGRGPAHAGLSRRGAREGEEARSSARSASSRTRRRVRAYEAAARRIYPPEHPFHRRTGEERIALRRGADARGARGASTGNATAPARCYSSSSATSPPTGSWTAWRSASASWAPGPKAGFPALAVPAPSPGRERSSCRTRPAPTS